MKNLFKISTLLFALLVNANVFSQKITPEPSPIGSLWSTCKGGIKYSNNVGIGTAPTHKLHVAGTIYSTSSIYGTKFIDGSKTVDPTGTSSFNRINTSSLFVNGVAVTGGSGVADNLGNHTATKNLNMNNHEIDNVKYLDVKSGYGNGLRFWSSNSYSIAMGNSSIYHYGPVTDYSIKMNMSNTVGRGWTWGTYNIAPVAALSKDGTFQVKNNIYALGNVGIGTTTPGAKLSIKNGWGDFMNFQRTKDAGFWRIHNPQLQDRLLFGFESASGERNFHILALSKDGTVGINTAFTNGYTLAVDGTLGVSGKITCKEIEVKTDVWSDYVFNKDYNLKSLSFVEQFIKKNNHLPDVPSEKEVKENGINIGDMNAVLLKKIEELTLYVIEQNKKIDTLQIQLNNLKK